MRGPWCGAESLDKHRRWLEHRGRLRIETSRIWAKSLAAFDTLTELSACPMAWASDAAPLSIVPRMRGFIAM